MSVRASIDEDLSAPSEELKKEAIDALAQLKTAEQAEVFDYFKALLEFQKHASEPK